MREHLLLGLLAPVVATGCGDDEPPRGTVEITTFEQTRAGPSAVRAAAAGCEPSGLPEAGVPIIIQAPDGSTAVAVTDADGEASIEVVSGSAVTASYAANECGGQQFNSFLAVEPGDHLRFGARQALIEVGVMTLGWPAADGAEHVEVIYSCGSLELGLATSAVLPFFTDCGVPTAHAMVVAYAGAGGDTPIAWAPFGHFPFEDGGAVSVAELQAPTTQAIEMTGIPPSVTRAWINASPHIGDNPTVRPFVTAYGEPEAGRLAASGPWAPGSEAVLVEAGFEGIAYGTQYAAERVAPGETIALDGPVLLPWTDAESVAVDLAGRTIAWTQTGDGAYDAAVVWTAWSRQRDDGWDHFQWALVAPPGAPSLAIPSLPAEFADLGPAVSDTVTGTVALVERSDVARLHEIPLWEALSPLLIDGERDDYPRVVVSGP